MKKFNLLLVLILSSTLFTACRDEAISDKINNSSEKINKKLKETSVTSEKKEIDTKVNGKNYVGTMGKLSFKFSFIDNNRYIEKSVYSVATGDSVRLTEGTYKVKDDEILLKDEKNTVYSQYQGSPENEAYSISEENSREPFERLFIKDNNQLLITYTLNKEEIEKASDDAYGDLSVDDNQLNDIETVKSKLTLVKDTSNFFRINSEFSNWVLNHMAKTGYMTRNLVENVKLDENTLLRYSVNIFAEGYEQAPGTTIGIDFEGNMYEDTPRDGKPRQLSHSTKWDEILTKDIENGEVTLSDERKAYDKLYSIRGIWAVVPGDSGFEILDNGNFEVNSGPGEKAKIRQVSNVSVDGDRLNLELDGKKSVITIVDEETLKLDDGATFKKQPNRY